MDLENKKKLVVKYNPIAFRTAIQGVEGNYWFYEAHIKGVSFKFRVDTNLRPKETLEKKMNSIELIDWLIEY